MINREELLAELAHEIQFYSKHTRDQYNLHVHNYLDWVRRRDVSLSTWSDRETLYAYMDSLKRKKFSQNHIAYVVRGPIGSLFRMYGRRLPVKLPKKGGEGVLDIASRKQFNLDELKILVATARESGNLQWQNLVALATVYGLRAGEIAAVQKADLHPQKKSFLVHTEKNGLLREHLVPAAISPIIFKHSYPDMRGARVFMIFAEVAAKAGVDRGEGPRLKGIHAVRHGVFSALHNLADAQGHRIYDEADVFRFFRWAGGTVMATYSHAEMLEIDERIFAHHPILKYWQ